MICEKCGAENAETSKFCKGCGAPLTKKEETVSSTVVNIPTQVTTENGERVNTPSSITINTTSSTNGTGDYQPISMWGYFGYEVLFSIPCIGLIALVIFSFGGTTNVNVKNFARSYFCFIILMVVILFVLTSMGGMAAMLSY